MISVFTQSPPGGASAVILSSEMLINTVNDNDEITGVIEHSRVFAHHAMFRVVHLFLFNHNNELLLQQLSPQRERHPAAWGSSVAGYVLAGETYEQAATRRVQQELGVTCDLHHFGKTTMIDEGCKKFITLFLATCEGPFSYDHDHIAALESLRVDRIRQLHDTRARVFTPTFLHVLDFYDHRT